MSKRNSHFLKKFSQYVQNYSKISIKLYADIRHKKARPLSHYYRIEMGKRDNYKEYIDIVNEAV